MFIPSNPMALADLMSAISHPRLSNYRSFFQTSSDMEALGLYQWNEDLSAGLFRALTTLEVVLRNQFHRVLSLHYGGVGATHSRDWYAHLKLSSLSAAKVQEVTHKKKAGAWVPRNPPRSPDDVVSKLTFGFWPHLLDVQLDTLNAPVLWKNLIPLILPGHRQKSPEYWKKQASQDQLFARLDLCNELRNRIAHHEPIWKLGPLLAETRARQNFVPAQIKPAPTNAYEAVSRLVEYYGRVKELLSWLSPAVAMSFEGSEWDGRCRALLTLSAVNHYKNLRPAGEVQLRDFIGNRRLKKALKFAAKQKQPTILLNGTVRIGQLLTPAK